MPTQVNVGDFDTCKNAGGKLSKAADGTWVCTLKDKMYKDKGASAKASETHVQAVATEKFSKIEITSDGTKAGTKILINGKEIYGLASASFYFYNDSYSSGNNVCISYSTEDISDEKGVINGRTYYSVIPPKATASDHTVEMVPVIASLMPRGNERRKLFSQI